MRLERIVREAVIDLEAGKTRMEERVDMIEVTGLEEEVITIKDTNDESDFWSDEEMLL